MAGHNRPSLTPAWRAVKLASQNPGPTSYRTEPCSDILVEADDHDWQRLSAATLGEDGDQGEVEIRGGRVIADESHTVTEQRSLRRQTNRNARTKQIRFKPRKV